MDTLCRPAPDTSPQSDEPRTVADLADSLCAGAANLTAYEYRWLSDLAEFDRRRGWLQWEQPSCAAWLSWQVGLDARSAREKVRVARALAEMPHVAGAMERGHLCYSKVRAITRVATPATEESLVSMALVSTTAQLERIVAGTRRALAAVNGDAAQRWAGRRLDHRIDDDGMVMVTMRLTADDAAVFLAAVEQFVAEVEPAEHLRDSARPMVVDDGQPESTRTRRAVTAAGEAMRTSGRVPLAARRADAAVALAQAAVSSGASLAAQPLVTLHVDCRSSTRSTPTEPPGSVELSGSGELSSSIEFAGPVELAGSAGWAEVGGLDAGPERVEAQEVTGAWESTVVSRLIATSAAEGSWGTAEVSAAAGIPPVASQAGTPAAVHVNRCEPDSVECSVEAPQALSPVSIGIVAAGRHCCDAVVEVATHHADRSVTMSPRVGVVRGRQRRAVLARDRHCQFPGCSRSAGVEIHHLVHRAHGGGNGADNLVVLCRFHHHRLHDERWSARRTSAGLVFSSPDGRVVGQPSTITGAAQTVLDLDRTAADGRSRWAGDPLHLVEALGFLASAAAVAERAARGRFAVLVGRDARGPLVGAA